MHVMEFADYLAEAETGHRVISEQVGSLLVAFTMQQ